MTDWRDLTLDQLGRIVTGKTPPTADSENYGGSIPFVTPSDMDGRRTISDTARYLTAAGLRTVANAKIPHRSVMVSCIGSDMGKAAISGSECVTNQQINSIIVDDNFESTFVYYNLSVRKDEIRSAASGSAQPIMNKSTFGRLRIRVPNKARQIAIASVLGALDDKIELNRRMNETLEAMARTIFKDWFVDFGPTRAKIEGRAPYLAPEIWSLFPDRIENTGKPTGWSIEAVYEQAAWVNGAAYKDMHFSSEPDALPVVKIAELKSGITKTTRFTNTDLGERYKIRDGELLFSWSGNPDTSIDTFVWTWGAAWLNQHIFAVRSNGKRSQAFLYTMLKLLRGEFAEIARNKQTTGLGHVTQQDLIRLKISAPSREVEAAFDDIVGPLHARFTSNLFENRSLVAIRDFLLPKLMAGEVRVKDAEKLVGEAT